MHLQPHLRTRALGRVHEHHRSLPSTNDRAAAWAREGAPHGALVTADLQTAGRGRRGRSWVSSCSDNVYASVIIRPGPLGAGLGPVALAVGVGLREAIAGLAVPVELKWPNDLLVAGRKLGGILCEARWMGKEPEVVVGFGINVGQLEFGPQLRERATSLALHGAKTLDRAHVLSEVLASLEPTLETFFAHGFAGIRERYEAHCPIFGRRIELDEGDGPRVVLAERLDEDGALLVREPGAGLRRIETADVWLAGP